MLVEEVEGVEVVEVNVHQNSIAWGLNPRLLKNTDENSSFSYLKKGIQCTHKL
jgi:hypothetical protein